MLINVFGEASFSLRSRKLVNFFGVTLRYATEQPSSLGCNYVREMSEGFKIEFILCKGDLTMRAKVERKKNSLIDHKRMTSQISISHTALSCRLLLLSSCFFHSFMIKNVDSCANRIPSMSPPHRSSSQLNIVRVRLNLINHLVGFILRQICLYFSN